MGNNKIDCDGCGGHAEDVHSEACKTYCRHCVNNLWKEIRKLKKERDCLYKIIYNFRSRFTCSLREMKIIEKIKKEINS